MSRPIVLCTDYGLQDEFVGICHAVIASIAPDARVIDLTHAIPRQDVGRGSLVLARAAPYLPADSVICAVVDPGVGSERQAIAVQASSGALLVGPDNGLLSMAWDVLGGAAAAHAIQAAEVLLHPVSKTFHGRDVFAPAAAHLANGIALEQVGPAVDPAGLRRYETPSPMVAPGAIGARVLGVDGFGNVQLNATAEHLAAAGLGPGVRIGERDLPIVNIFADLSEQGLGVIVDSQGFLALVVNKGSAAEVLNLSEGDAVVLESSDEGDEPPPGPRHLQAVE
jgi:hypothetical protein